MRPDILHKRAAEAKEKRALERRQQHAFNLGVLQRAAVDQSVLTADPRWNAYLQQVAALNAADQRQLDDLQARIDSAEYLSPEQAQTAAFTRRLLLARIHTRNECLEIPKRIQGAARSAQ